MCADISFTQEVTRGTSHSHSPEEFRKEEILYNGPNNRACRLSGSVITDRVGGHFMLIVKPSKTNSNNNMGQFHGIDEVIFRTLNFGPLYDPQDLRLNTI